MRIIVTIFILLGLSACDVSSSQGAILSAHKLYENGLYNKAISKVFRAESKYEYSSQEEAELKYIMAESYKKLGELDKAGFIYYLIIEKYPDTIFADLSNTVIKELNAM